MKICGFLQLSSHFHYFWIHSKTPPKRIVFLYYQNRRHKKRRVFSTAYISCERISGNLKTPEKPLNISIFGGSEVQFSVFIEMNYIPICFATSSAKFSDFFSRPSPVSKRTKPLTAILAPTAFATDSTYLATDCLPSSAFT